MSLKKWKKIELLDLADKLDVHVAHSSTKAVIAEAIDTHLNGLETPLDLQEFPELASYYEASSGSESSADEVEKVVESGGGGNGVGGGDEDGNGSDEESEGSDGSEGVDGSEGAEGWFSKLDFGKVSPSNAGFAFKFHEFLQDVQARAFEANESVQDALSTIPAVDAVFMAIELYVYVLCARVNFDANVPYIVLSVGWRELLALVSFWTVWSLALPALVAYYVNFIRYDLPEVAVDPMVFHVTKALLSLLLTQWQPSFASEATFTVKDVAGHASALDITAHWFRYALVEWKIQLGLMPVVMACAGTALCLYVL